MLIRRPASDAHFRKCREIAEQAMHIIAQHTPGRRLSNCDINKLFALLAVFDGLAYVKKLLLPEHRLRPLPIFSPEAIAAISTEFQKTIAKHKTRSDDRRFIDARTILDMMTCGAKIDKDRMDAYPSLVVITSALMEVGLNP